METKTDREVKCPNKCSQVQICNPTLQLKLEWEIYIFATGSSNETEKQPQLQPPERARCMQWQPIFSIHLI